MNKTGKKIKLTELNVQSFITSNKLRSIFGGQPPQLTGQVSDVDPSGDSGKSESDIFICKPTAK